MSGRRVVGAIGSLVNANGFQLECASRVNDGHCMESRPVG